MQSNLYIPKKIKVGFEGRGDTFTGRLAFVNYEKEDGEISRKKTFDNWRDKNIPIEDFDNTPQDNYVFNKSIERSGNRFSNNTQYVRVHDSRGFEFEITIDNAFSILMYSDVLKCSISEKCVYAWSGQRLVLLPVNSKEYKESVTFTEKQSKQIEADSMIIGASYTQKSKDTIYTYLGKLEQYSESDASRSDSFYNYSSDKKFRIKKAKHHFFYNHEYDFVEKLTIKSLAECVDESMHQDFPKLFKSLSKDRYNEYTSFNKYSLKEIDVNTEIKHIKSRYGSCIFYKKTENKTITCIDYPYFFDYETVFKKSDFKVVYFNEKNDYTGNINKKGLTSTINLKKQVFGDNKEISMSDFYEKIKSLGYKNLLKKTK